MRRPLNLQKWIEEHRPMLKPPVGNRAVWEDTEFMITVVAGPNTRKDFHVDEGEEFFFQLEGDISLKIAQDGKVVDLPIRQGEIFLLPPKVPHSPRRPAGTLGLVIERQRRSDELDGFLWFCDGCGEKLHEEFLHVKSLVADLPPVFERFYGNPALTRCQRCGTVNKR